MFGVQGILAVKDTTKTNGDGRTDRPMDGRMDAHKFKSLLWAGRWPLLGLAKVFFLKKDRHVHYISFASFVRYLTYLGATLF